MNVDFTGDWSADLAASRLHGPPPKEVRFSIVHSEPMLDAELTMTMMDGSVVQLVFRARTTGERVANTVSGSEWQTEAVWVGPELMIESWVKHPSRELHFRDYWSLSSDGRTLTMEHRDDDLAGQLTILRRVDSAAY